MIDAGDKLRLLRENIAKIIKGKEEIINMVLITLLARGHLLIEDVPGVGKTTLAQGLAKSINCSFQRIQFTCDLLPSDILGVSIYNPVEHQFEFKAGPIFANVILADEINRTTPKTQSCLLEAMNEFQVSIDKNTYALPFPFMVIATQNPIEYEGTYPLPESQLDRFLMRIRIGYPDKEDEKEILMTQGAAQGLEEIQPVVQAEEVLQMQRLLGRVRMDESLVDYILAIVSATRTSPSLSLGVSPRGTLFLYRASLASALLDGRDYCLPDDIKRVAIPVLSHRVIVNPSTDSFGKNSYESESIIQEILEKVPVPL